MFFVCAIFKLASIPRCTLYFKQLETHVEERTLLQTGAVRSMMTTFTVEVMCWHSFSVRHCKSFHLDTFRVCPAGLGKWEKDANFRGLLQPCRAPPHIAIMLGYEGIVFLHASTEPDYNTPRTLCTLMQEINRGPLGRVQRIKRGAIFCTARLKCWGTVQTCWKAVHQIILLKAAQ